MRPLCILIAILLLVTSLPARSAEALTEQQARFVSANLANDSDGDGVLNETEAGVAFATLDSDRSGFVDAEELRAFARLFFRPFTWVNPLPAGLELPPGVAHGTFESPSMQHPVGYVIFLPPGYESAANASRRYPVVYYLHGGRPGNESRSVALTSQIHDAMAAGKVPPAIYVFANGGEVSHYNVPARGSMGEDVIVKELIPHIDATYRTVATRSGRAIEGFSQGGRGVTRIAFKHSRLFVSAAAGGPGYGVERSVYENDGVEEDARVAGSERYEFGKGNDAYSQAIGHSQRDDTDLQFSVWIGKDDFNYESTLEYLGFLYAIGIESRRFIVAGIGHNPIHMYQEIGIELMCFHASAFAASGQSPGC